VNISSRIPGPEFTGIMVTITEEQEGFSRADFFSGIIVIHGKKLPDLARTQVRQDLQKLQQERDLVPEP